MADSYTAGDYAGLSGGRYSFYYGYEQTDPHDNWLFIGKIDGIEIVAWTAEQLDMEQFDDTARILMRGIAKFLDQFPALAGQ